MWRQLKLQLNMSDTEHETQILMKASFGNICCLFVKKESSLETLFNFWQKKIHAKGLTARPEKKQNI